MQHPGDITTIETDDMDELVAWAVTQATDGSQLVHLTVRLNGRKQYDQADDTTARTQPARLFLTNGVNPRYLRPVGYGE